MGAAIKTGKFTVEEMIGSLTGYEEIAITKAFEADIFTLLDDPTPITAGRALVFIDHKRKGESDEDAKDHAMNLPVRDVDAYFAEDEDEVMPEEPVTESGKDSKQSG